MTEKLKIQVIKASEALKNGDVKEAEDLIRFTQDLNDDEYMEVIQVIAVNGSIAGSKLY